MGRYISGDIEGKCWFGVQDSNFADRFGQAGFYTEINYNFDSAELPIIEKELAKIKRTLGQNLVKLDKFFEEHGCYSDKELAEYLGVTEDDLYGILREYADYIKGVQIRDCIKENGACCFSVEL